jgi:tripartite-type tricarboxylate transporter receptor subunit TctC
MDMTRRSFNQSSLALASLSAVPAVFSQPIFPSRPLKLMIPFVPGGGTDIVGRAVAQKLGSALGQTVVVENRAGANGTIGANTVAKSPADGYNLCLLTASHSVNVTLQGQKQPYDLNKDFDPLIHLAVQPYILVVKPGLPVKSVADLIALAKARPGSLNFGSSGIGGLVHLSAELFATLANIKITHVPYKGGAEAMMDVIAGNVDFMFTSLNQSKSFIDSGQLKLLAVTSTERSPAIPNTPTMREAGVPDYEVVSWYGMAVPAGVPAPVLAKLNSAINEILKQPDMQAKMAADGSTSVGGTPAQFGKFLRAEVDKWRKQIEHLNIRVG